ncbi:MAG: type II toxin-antitoxin system Phd/YefM family antitoxin [bacterium]|nr:type II toxin-antitoxin system Phd/YefM family antitoxin [bacterium]
MVKKYLSITEARKDFFKIAQECQKPDSHFVLTINGKPEVVLISFEEYEALLETVDFLSEPGALEDLEKAEKEIENGEFFDFDIVKQELDFARKGAMVLAEKPHQKYQPKKRKK